MYVDVKGASYMSRRMLALGKSAAAFLGLVLAWGALGATFAGTDSVAASNSEKSKFAQEIVVLEFIEKDVPQCERTNPLIDEMRRKGYPIQLVERATGGDVLFEQYDVENTPTFVFLVDGKETERLVVEKESVTETRDRLLALFRKSRNEISKGKEIVTTRKQTVTTRKETVTTRGQVLEPERFATSGAQYNPPQPKYGRTAPISAKRDATPSINAPSINAPSNGVGAPREANSYGVERSISQVCPTQVRAFVGARGSNEERIGSGVVVHYNEEYGEALTLVPAALFAGISDPTNMTNTTLDIISSTSGARENVAGQCVFCDVQAGLAFVAARVASPVAPVAFLPTNDAPRVGEAAVVATFNNNNEFVPTQREIMSCDFGSFRLASGDGADRRGSGVFLVRNERLYFSGLYTSNDEEGRGVVASIAAVNQILLANGNLTTVYRDQVAGKYEALTLARSDAQFSSPLLDSTSRVDSNKTDLSKVDLSKVDPSTNMSDVFESADVESNALSALSKLPNGEERISRDPTLRLDSPNAPTLDAASVFANAGGSIPPMQTSVSDVPSVLKKTPDSDVAAKETENKISYESSISLATNEGWAQDSRAQEIPVVSREFDGSANTNEIRSTNYASRQNDRMATAIDQETRLFESSLDELRRLSLEGAEIICIVNWGASSNETRARETEVVRLPRRKSAVATNSRPFEFALSSGETPSTRASEETKFAAPNAPQSQTTITGVSDSGFFR